MWQVGGSVTQAGLALWLFTVGKRMAGGGGGKEVRKESEKGSFFSQSK